MKRVDVKEQARQRELRVLDKWRTEETFEASIRNREGQENFVFYEGPPTANGIPHIGHVLGRTIKDSVARYKTMQGYRVKRKAGWDTHGLPVELGVEKALGISGKKQIEEYGVEKFITKCKESVFTYENKWRELTEAIAYWTDLDHPYVTLQNDYIETVWNILSTVHRKGLLYRGHRVSPYCPSCQTTLSSHEVAQGYEDVKDMTVTVKFKLQADEAPADEAALGDVYALAWTTTPWTLPGNVALAVNPKLDYVFARVADGTVYVLGQSLADRVLKEEYEVLKTVKGSALAGRHYAAPFNYVEVKNGHVVLAADFVTESGGTGIVHIAPAHGEDDYRVVRSAGVGFVNLVDLSGHYVPEVTDFAGRFVKEDGLDLEIVKWLAARGLLFSKEKHVHSYPFCWRCHTPLLYYAIDSWFIEMTKVRDQLIANNQGITWYPAHIRDGRMGKFLEDIVDWNISRTRYWGTPLNIWECSTCGGEYAPESRADLAARAVEKISEDIELHKPYVDDVHLHCPHCAHGIMTRTPEVIDVWFDSGSMPFAQQHVPFEHAEEFSEQFPADFITEGIDQTRGWFYSLLAVSTLYKGVAPYKSVISSGLVLDEDGQKMSKSKGNVIDPWEMINAYGTDATRWSLLADSAPWNNKRLSRGVIAEAKSKVIDTIVNTHAFFSLYASIDGYEPAAAAPRVSHVKLDQWIVSRLNSLIKVVRHAMESYDFMQACKAIEGFVDELSNWYIRRSRERFWGQGLTDDKLDAYSTLHHVLLTLAQVIAPFTPLLAEDIYCNLTGQSLIVEEGSAGEGATGEAAAAVGSASHTRARVAGGVSALKTDSGVYTSVHLTDYPATQETAIDADLERDMQTAQSIVELARNVRNESGIKNRQPLGELIVSLAGEFPLADYEAIILDEINVKRITVVHGDGGFVDYVLKLNLRIGGRKYGKRVGAIQSALRALSSEDAAQVVHSGAFHFTTPDGEELTLPLEELLIEKKAREGFSSASGYGMTVALNTEITPDLYQEGLVREVIRAVQDTRKKRDLQVEQYVDLDLYVNDEYRAALEANDALLHDSVLLKSVHLHSVADRTQVDASELQELSVGNTTLGIVIHA